ncbi:hypothetical protein KBTX_02325 [wastewater metagenome]|uniref:Uncharacterized protein n=2 Tax=unclassified sequences TaxID=12908 RepID=A0A5B8RBB9_9ZZZZ|nr:MULTISPECIES: copper resistance protein NlpE N-terminal domain-containing protein [Arhodomonas]QEA05996.1 hypothetical protein KBTEX_02325 [uncultured organism]
MQTHDTEQSRRLTALLTMAMLVVLAGCSTPPPRSGPAFKPAERFVGTLPCEDCGGIRTDLVIHRDPETGRPSGFLLNRERIDAAGGERTSSAWGSWEVARPAEGKTPARYHMTPEIGRELYYERRSNGALQPVSTQGERLTGADGRAVVLEPRPVRFPPTTATAMQRPDTAED